MKELTLPEFKTYEEEADFWDNLDTASFMEDDGEWLRFDSPNKRAVKVAILPELVEELVDLARIKKVSVETLVNTYLMQQIHETAA